MVPECAGAGRVYTVCIVGSVKQPYRRAEQLDMNIEASDLRRQDEDAAP